MLFWQNSPRLMLLLRFANRGYGSLSRLRNRFFNGAYLSFSSASILIMRFSIGDLVVYGETGVCRVEEIVEKEFLGEIRPCYRLQPLYQSCMIFTPADNEAVFMRPILTSNEAKALISNINEIVPSVCKVSSPRELSGHYDKIIKLHDCYELVALIKAINIKREQAVAAKKKFSAVDERYLKRAEDLLFGELAVALSIEKFNVREYINEKLEVK